MPVRRVKKGSHPPLNEYDFRTLADLAPVGLFRTDSEGNCLYVNAKWCELSGMELEEALGTGWVSALHPDDAERVTAEWYSAAKESRPFRCDYRFLSRNGTSTWLRGTASALYSGGELTGYVGTVTDIADRHAAEERLRLSERQLRFVTDSAPVGIARCDRDCVCRFVNRSYARRLGMEPDELIGRHIAEFLGKDAFDAITPAIETVLSGKSVEFELEVARHIRNAPALEDVKLAALTGWGQENDRQRSLSAGFNYHLVKPADEVEIVSILSDLQHN